VWDHRSDYLFVTRETHLGGGGLGIGRNLSGWIPDRAGTVYQFSRTILND
jgi:hypothetical protein